MTLVSNVALLSEVSPECGQRLSTRSTRLSHAIAGKLRNQAVWHPIDINDFRTDHEHAALADWQWAIDGRDVHHRQPAHGKEETAEHDIHRLAIRQSLANCFALWNFGSGREVASPAQSWPLQISPPSPAGPHQSERSGLPCCWRRALTSRSCSPEHYLGKLKPVSL